MIEPAFSTSLDGQKLAIRDILMTMRGSLLIKRFAFDFTYLQLVVEDYMLEFPAYLVNDFAFQPKVNYGYLLQKHDDYQQRAIEMINFKCDQVFLFLMILEVTHAVEVERRSITFERLATRGVARLNFEQIRGNLRSAILNIGKALHSDGIEARVKNAIDVAERSRRRLDEFFRDAYLLHQV
jgi:hypothetical protein